MTGAELERQLREIHDKIAAWMDLLFYGEIEGIHKGVQWTLYGCLLPILLGLEWCCNVLKDYPRTILHGANLYVALDWPEDDKKKEEGT